MLTPAKAAQIAQVSRTTIMNAIKSSDLHAVRDNKNRWQINESDLKAWSGFADKVPLKVSESVMKDDAALELSTKVAVLEAEVRGRDALIEQLRLDLDHARMPFWQRFLSGKSKGFKSDE